jgi:RecB family exonuclease
MTMMELARLKKKGSKPILSASQTGTYRRCNRKWAWTYIDGIVTPPNLAMAFGTEVHTVLERYITTGRWMGKDDAIATARQCEHTLPLPKSELVKVEHPFNIDVLGGKARFIGFIDLLDGSKFISNILEVGDYKTTKDLRYAMDEEDLPLDIQCNIYSKWAMDHFNVDKVVARWRYLCARPKAGNQRPRTPRGFKDLRVVMVRDEVEEQWERILREAAEMVAIVEDESRWALDIKPNRAACGDYGGCPFRSRCGETQESLGALISHSKVAHLKESPNKEREMGESLMDIINRAKAKKEASAAPATGVNPPPVTEAPDPELAKAAEKPIPQAWVDRLQKGHKPRAADEKTWRAEQEQKMAPEPAQDTISEALQENPDLAPTGSKVAVAKTEAPAPASKFVLYVDCLPVKCPSQSILTLSELLRPLKDAVAKMKDVPYWNVLPFREGEQLLAACAEQQFTNGERPMGVILADSGSMEWKACGDVLTEIADVVVRGT